MALYGPTAEVSKIQRIVLRDVAGRSALRKDRSFAQYQRDVAFFKMATAMKTLYERENTKDAAASPTQFVFSPSLGTLFCGTPTRDKALSNSVSSIVVQRWLEPFDFNRVLKMSISLRPHFETHQHSEILLEITNSSTNYQIQSAGQRSICNTNVPECLHYTKATNTCLRPSSTKRRFAQRQPGRCRRPAPGTPQPRHRQRRQK